MQGNYKHIIFDESVNITQSHPLKSLFWMLAIAFSVIVTLYIILVFVLDLLTPHLGVGAEKWLWDNIYSHEFEALMHHEDEKMQAQQAYLQHLLDRIPKTDLPPLDYQVMLDDSDVINAYALPGGYIVMNKGLIDKLDSENAIMFVLGHELGHFANRDHLRGLGRVAIALTISALLTGQSSGASDMIGYIDYFAQSYVSRDQESKADMYGLKALGKVYGHAGGATNLFEILKAQESSIKWQDYLSTHPSSETRIQKLHEQMQKQQLDIQTVLPKKQ